MRRLYPYLFPSLLLVLWEAVARGTTILGKYLPPPTAIVLELIRLLGGGDDLWLHLKATLVRLVLAFILAAVPGVALGLLMGLSPLLRALLEPYILALFPLPKIALLPLFMIVSGVNERTWIITASVTAFFQIIVSTLAGVMSLDHHLLEAAHNFGARGPRLFFKVLLPGALPQIFTGLRLGLGLALVLTIVVEFTATNDGLGQLVWRSWQTLSVSTMFAGFVVVGLLGAAVTRGLERLGDRLMPWHEDLTRGRAPVRSA